MADLNPDWLVPDWPVPANVKAVFTTRSGGVSRPPFESLNLGEHVGDALINVQANRAQLAKACGAHPVFLKQVHGAEVATLTAATPDGQSADACVTAQRQLACTIMVADCLPVLLTLADGAAVAAAHAGWRGLAGQVHNSAHGVLETVAASLSASFRADVQSGRAQAAIKIVAWLGPCIGPSAFEVGAEVKAAFEASQRGAGRFFVPAAAGKYLADLAGLARQRLQALGITDVYGNDGSDTWCTVRNPARYFSHRRDAGANGNGFATTGRMAACVWMD